MSNVQKKKSYKRLNWINNWWSKLAIQDSSKNKFGFFILLEQIRGKKQSPTVWEMKRGSFYSQIEKTTFIIGVSK